MIRRSFVVPKDKLFDIMNNSVVVCISRRTGKGQNKLKDESLCSIYVYYKLTTNEKKSVESFLKRCYKLACITTTTEQKSFVASLPSCYRQHGFLTGSHCRRIIEISKLYPKYNFKIPYKLFNKILEHSFID